MPRNFFITGEPKAGKTTLLKEIVKQLKKKGLRVGGFISPDERHHGTRTGFKVMDLESGKMAALAGLDGDGPRVSKYHVDVRSFESIALPAMKKSGGYDVMVIDEIGLMELKSRKFADLLDDLLESDTPLIATLHLAVLDKYGTAGEVIELDQENRGIVYERLLEEAGASLTRKKEKPKEPAPQRTKKKEPPKKTKKAAKAAKKKEEKPQERAKPSARKPPKVEMEETAVQEVKHEKKKPEGKKEGGLLHRIKKLFGS